MAEGGNVRTLDMKAIDSFYSKKKEIDGLS